MNSVLRFFDLYSEYRATDARPQSANDEEIATWRQIVVYVACVVGILLGPFVVGAATGTYPAWLEVVTPVSKLIWALILGFVLTAFLFKVLVSPKAAIFVQIGTGLACGFGSGELVPIAIKVLTAHG